MDNTEWTYWNISRGKNSNDSNSIIKYEETGYITLKRQMVLMIIEIFSQKGYGSGRNAPGKKGIGTYSYISAHNQIRAHAYAYR